MEKIWPALIVSFAMVAACSRPSVRPDRTPTREELVGEFHMGDGHGLCEQVDLRADSTFHITYCSAVHRGGQSWSEEGRWGLSGSNIFFFDKNGNYKTLQFETYAKVFYLDGQPVFVMARDLKLSGIKRSVFVFGKKGTYPGLNPNRPLGSCSKELPIALCPSTGT
jgi:hypothetical protein